MHKDLTDDMRAAIEESITEIVECVHSAGQSLAISREAMINAFDREAAKLDGGEPGEV